MDAKTSINILSAQMEEIENLERQKRFSNDFKKWHRDTSVCIEKIFGSNTRHSKDFSQISYSSGIWYSGMPESASEKEFTHGLQEARAVLESMMLELDRFGNDTISSNPPDYIFEIERLCGTFHKVCRQLRQRHNDRETLDVNDEYDVQDLLHALLHIHFDDIRPEEWTPSYAGSSSRVDFLIKQHRIVIEVKKTRPGLKAKELAEQLIIDIARYESHPDCKHLICFVYDPDGLIRNPRGIENDLNQDKDIKVFVIIAPK